MLIYLAVLPLFMLVYGSFEKGMRRENLLLLWKIITLPYASPYTYSTFVNSIIFASGSATLTFLLGTMLAWLTERTNTRRYEAFLCRLLSCR